jgi:hypothetical protein
MSNALYVVGQGAVVAVCFVVGAPLGAALGDLGARRAGKARRQSLVSIAVQACAARHGPRGSAGAAVDACNRRAEGKHHARSDQYRVARQADREDRLQMAGTGFSSCTGCNAPGLTRLIVIRGNSASGKATIASLIREKHGRGIALVGQDNLRRVVLREHDTACAANIGLIDLTCRYSLANGFHVVLEGILRAEHYGEMLAGLRAEYAGRSSWWFLDVGFSETLERHGTKPQASEYGEAEMRSWWLERDFLPGGFEQVITADESAEAAATRIMTVAGLTGGIAL